MNDYSGTSYWKTKSLLTFFLALEKCTVVLGIGWTMPICVCVPWFWSHKVKIRDPPPDDLLFIFCLPLALVKIGVGQNSDWKNLKFICRVSCQIYNDYNYKRDIIFLKGKKYYIWHETLQMNQFFFQIRPISSLVYVTLFRGS